MRIDDDAEQAVRLYRILPTLPAHYSRIIWQVNLLGQSRRKVAKTLRISENNLGVRIHRARSALRSALQRFCATCPTHGLLKCACEEEMRSTRLKSRSRKRLWARPGLGPAIASGRSRVEVETQLLLKPR